MLDHMMFAHEMDDGGINTDANATEINNQTRLQDESNSNNDETDKTTQEDEKGLQTTSKTIGNCDSVDVFNHNNHFSQDNATNSTNMEIAFDTTDGNIVVVETVECKPDFCVEEKTIKLPTTPRKGLEKSSYGSEKSDNQEIDEVIEDEDIIVNAKEASKPTSVKIIKVSLVLSQTSLFSLFKSLLGLFYSVLCD